MGGVLGSGGITSVFAGARGSGTQISGGTEYVFGFVIDDTIFFGSQVVESGGTASGTVVSGGTEIVSAGGLDIGALMIRGELAASGGTAVDLAVLGKGLVAGTAILSGPTIGSGAVLETLGGGSAMLAGAVTNSGILYASGDHSFLEIASGAVVTGGGIAEIGNGIVDLQTASDTENVAFHAGGIGGLDIGVLGNAYPGSVSGFGQNGHQFIDFTAISFTGATFSYTSTSPQGGVLTVTNGGTSASINLSGHYTSGSFHITDGAGGSVKFVETQSGPLGPPSTPSLIDFLLARRITLLGNYIAASFAANGHDGVLLTEPQHAEPQTLLTNPARLRGGPHHHDTNG